MDAEVIKYSLTYTEPVLIIRVIGCRVILVLISVSSYQVSFIISFCFAFHDAIIPTAYFIVNLKKGKDL